MKRKRRKLSSTFNDRLVRRNLTSTSPLPTRVDVVEVTVDAEVVAAVKDVDVEDVDVVMVKDAHPTGKDGLIIVGVASPSSHSLDFEEVLSVCFHFYLTGSAVKVRRVSVAHQGNPGSQDQRERKASNSQGTDGMQTICANLMHLNFDKDTSCM